MSVTNQIVTLLNAATVTGAGVATAAEAQTANRVYKASAAATSGAFTATVAIEVSMTGVAWVTLAVITLSGTGATPNSDGFASAAPWPYVRGNVTAITGTGTTVTLRMGV